MNEVRLIEIAAIEGDAGPIHAAAAIGSREGTLETENAAVVLRRDAHSGFETLDEPLRAEAGLIGDGGDGCGVIVAGEGGERESDGGVQVAWAKDLGEGALQNVEPGLRIACFQHLLAQADGMITPQEIERNGRVAQLVGGHGKKRDRTTRVETDAGDALRFRSIDDGVAGLNPGEDGAGGRDFAGKSGFRTVQAGLVLFQIYDELGRAAGEDSFKRVGLGPVFTVPETGDKAI